jgi:methylmalonyl-CoA mutase
MAHIISTDFPPVSKAEWLERITKDLKDKSLSDLYWSLPEGIRVDPFGHADDFGEPIQAVFDGPLQWEICESVTIADPVLANRQILEALEGGVEGLALNWTFVPDADALAAVFEGVFMDFVGLHFEGAVVGNPAFFLSQVALLTKQKGQNVNALNGTIAYDPAQHENPDWRYLIDFLDYVRSEWPNFRGIQIKSELQGADTVSELKQLLQAGNFYVEKMTQRGADAAKVAAQMHFEITVGKSYFLEMAKIRAFKLLWANVLKAWGVSPSYPQVSAVFKPGVYADDLYTNMIRATTMAMSSVLGGADRLTVLPYDAGRETHSSYPVAFGRRIARNVQHLLKMETYLTEATDPMAGSYYLEKLTQQLCDKAWIAFQQP